MVSVVIKTEGIVQLAKTLTDLAYKKDMVLRAVATTMRAVVAYRIHTEGKAADGSLISQKGYSDAYYLRRQKAPYNREASKKVILSLTRQMENDFKVVETDKGYGIGFSNVLNADKSKWAEDTFKKRIYDLTPDELKTAQQTAQEYIQNIVNAIR